MLIKRCLNLLIHKLVATKRGNCPRKWDNSSKMTQLQFQRKWTVYTEKITGVFSSNQVFSALVSNKSIKVL